MSVKIPISADASGVTQAFSQIQAAIKAAGQEGKRFADLDLSKPELAGVADDLRRMQRQLEEMQRVERGKTASSLQTMKQSAGGAIDPVQWFKLRKQAIPDPEERRQHTENVGRRILAGTQWDPARTAPAAPAPAAPGAQPAPQPDAKPELPPVPPVRKRKRRAAPAPDAPELPEPAPEAEAPETPEVPPVRKPDVAPPPEGQAPPETAAPEPPPAPEIKKPAPPPDAPEPPPVPRIPPVPADAQTLRVPPVPPVSLPEVAPALPPGADGVAQAFAKIQAAIKLAGQEGKRFADLDLGHKELKAVADDLRRVQEQFKAAQRTAQVFPERASSKVLRSMARDAGGQLDPMDWWQRSQHFFSEGADRDAHVHNVGASILQGTQWAPGVRPPGEPDPKEDLPEWRRKLNGGDEWFGNKWRDTLRGPLGKPFGGGAEDESEDIAKVSKGAGGGGSGGGFFSKLFSVLPGGGMLAGGMKFAAGMAGVQGLGAMAAKGVGNAEDESVANDRLMRILRDTGTDFEALREKVRDASAAYGLTYGEGQQLSRQWASTTNETSSARTADSVQFAAGVARSYGEDPASVVQGLGRAKLQGEDPRKFAALIGESVRESGQTGRFGDVMEALLRWTEQSNRQLSEQPNTDKFAAAYSAISSEGKPGLQGQNAEAILDRINASLTQGGAGGEASQNLTFRALGRYGVTDPWEVQRVTEGGMFERVNRHDPKSPTLLQASWEEVNRMYAGTPTVKPGSETEEQADRRHSALGRHLGLSIRQVEAIEPVISGGQIDKMAPMLDKAGIALKDANPGAWRDLAGIAGDNHDQLLARRQRLFEDGELAAPQAKELRAASTDDEIRTALAKAVNARGLERDPGTQVTQSRADKDNALTGAATMLVGPLNDLRSSIGNLTTALTRRPSEILSDTYQRGVMRSGTRMGAGIRGWFGADDGLSKEIHDGAEETKHPATIVPWRKDGDPPAPHAPAVAGTRPVAPEAEAKGSPPESADSKGSIPEPAAVEPGVPTRPESVPVPPPTPLPEAVERPPHPELPAKPEAPEAGEGPPEGAHPVGTVPPLAPPDYPDREDPQAPEFAAVDMPPDLPRAPLAEHPEWHEHPELPEPPAGVEAAPGPVEGPAPLATVPGGDLPEPPPPLAPIYAVPIAPERPAPAPMERSRIGSVEPVTRPPANEARELAHGSRVDAEHVPFRTAVEAARGSWPAPPPSVQRPATAPQPESRPVPMPGGQPSPSRRAELGTSTASSSPVLSVPVAPLGNVSPAGSTSRAPTPLSEPRVSAPVLPVPPGLTEPDAPPEIAAPMARPSPLPIGGGLGRIAPAPDVPAPIAARETGRHSATESRNATLTVAASQSAEPGNLPPVPPVAATEDTTPEVTAPAAAFAPHVSVPGRRPETGTPVPIAPAAPVSAPGMASPKTAAIRDSSGEIPAIPAFSAPGMSSRQTAEAREIPPVESAAKASPAPVQGLSPPLTPSAAPGLTPTAPVAPVEGGRIAPKPGDSAPILPPENVPVPADPPRLAETPASRYVDSAPGRGTGLMVGPAPATPAGAAPESVPPIAAPASHLAERPPRAYVHSVPAGGTPSVVEGAPRYAAGAPSPSAPPVTAPTVAPVADGQPHISHVPVVTTKRPENLGTEQNPPVSGVVSPVFAPESRHPEKVVSTSILPANGAAAPNEAGTVRASSDLTSPEVESAAPSRANEAGTSAPNLSAPNRIPANPDTLAAKGAESPAAVPAIYPPKSPPPGADFSPPKPDAPEAAPVAEVAPVAKSAPVAGVAPVASIASTASTAPVAAKADAAVPAAAGDEIEVEAQEQADRAKWNPEHSSYEKPRIVRDAHPPAVGAAVHVDAAGHEVPISHRIGREAGTGRGHPHSLAMVERPEPGLPDEAAPAQLNKPTPQVRSIPDAPMFAAANQNMQPRSPVALSDAQQAVAPEGSRARAMLNLIGHSEGTDPDEKHPGRRGYDETLAYGKFTGGPVDLQNKTVAQVRELQHQMLAHPDNSMHSSAVGRYQVVGTTLQDAIKAGVVRPDEKFDAATQDRVGAWLLERRGLDRYQRGEISGATLQNNLAHEWASLPTTQGIGAYGGQNASVSPAMVQAALTGSAPSSAPLPRLQAAQAQQRAPSPYRLNASVNPPPLVLASAAPVDPARRPWEMEPVVTGSTDHHATGATISGAQPGPDRSFAPSPVIKGQSAAPGVAPATVTASSPPDRPDVNPAKLPPPRAGTPLPDAPSRTPLPAFGGKLPDDERERRRDEDAMRFDVSTSAVIQPLRVIHENHQGEPMHEDHLPVTTITAPKAWGYRAVG